MYVYNSEIIFNWNFNVFVFFWLLFEKKIKWEKKIVLLYIIDIESGSKVFKKISWVVFMWNYLLKIYLIIFVYYVFSEGYYMYE